MSDMADEKTILTFNDLLDQFPDCQICSESPVHGFGIQVSIVKSENPFVTYGVGYGYTNGEACSNALKDYHKRIADTAVPHRDSNGVSL
ncbi:MAG: hypothetical protein RLP44_02455 [Aggregatilineales bacterium]